MSLLYKLEYQDNFTDLEKGIANYILDHKDNTRFKNYGSC